MRFVLLLAGVFLGLLLGGLATVLLVRVPRWSERTPTASRWLLGSAVAAAVVASMAGLPLLLQDRAGPVGVASTVAPPAVLSLVALAVGVADRRFTSLSLWLIALLALGYVVVYGLGLGFFYLPTAALLVAAALARSVGVRPSATRPTES
jgi:hypothetical protein